MILIICAMESEAREIKTSIENIEIGKITPEKFYYKGTIKGKEVVLAITGVGKTNAALVTGIILSKFNFDYIINAGLVGGISPLKLGDRVVIKDASYHDVDVTAFNFGYELGQVPGMPNPFLSEPGLFKKALFSLGGIESSLYTGDALMTKRNPRYMGVFDMEGAAVYQVAYIFQTPIISLKLISDVIDSETQEDDYKRFEMSSSITIKDMVLAMI